MTRDRVNNAINIINLAKDNNISLSEASRNSGFGYKYVSNVKSDLLVEKKENTIDLDLFDLFMKAYDSYIESLNDDNDVIKLNGRNNSDVKYFEKNNEATVEQNLVVNQNEIKHIKTLEELLSTCSVDLKTWRVNDYTINKWDVTSWRNNKPETKQNFQIKAKLNRIIELVRDESVRNIFKDLVTKYVPPIVKYNLSQNNDVIPEHLAALKNEVNLLEISLFDSHFGKLAWHGETGEDYDTKIARKRYIEAIETLLFRAKAYNYERILFPIGNDYFNSDNLNNTTTKGTPQDEDLRWQKTFSDGVKLLVDSINILKQTGVPIDVIVIPGNHDFSKSYYCGSFIEAWFNNDEQVTVNNGASPRKYYRFGDVLLGFTHGSEEKESSLPLLMATDIESKPMWSNTKFHEWHLAHIHRKRKVDYTIVDKSRMVNEDLGVTVRYLSSLTGTEEWHHKKGYVGCNKAGDGFIWNDKTGFVAHINSNINI
jgi:hypothetical protein